MKFRKLLITTMFALSQIAMVLPVHAEAVQGTQGTQGVQDSQVTQQVQTQNPPVQEQVVPKQPNGNQADQGMWPDQPTAPSTDPSAPVGQDRSSGETTVPGTSDSGTEQLPPATVTGVPAAGGNGQLTLMMNSKKMYQNGKEYIAGNPMEVKKGVSYVAIRAIVERAGLQMSFDNKTKETIIKRGSDELRFKLNTTSYKVNGVVKTMKGQSYSSKNNTFMVPLTAITSALNIPYTVDQKAKKVTLTLNSSPVATFSIANKEVIAGETEVQYITNAYSPTGLQIINEEWQGREDMFMSPGNYVVTYRAQDSSGQWSKPFSLTIQVLKPHTPPVANFTTDKETYKMGELITYTDLSTDEVAIKEVIWENKEMAFFTPGPQTIRLKVVNPFGLTSTMEKTITITSETLYTKDDFYKLFTPVGEKFTFDGTQVPTWAKVNYSFTSEPTTLIRSNSPETVYDEGIVYRETAIGNTRFMVHHANSVGRPMKMYVLATNNNSVTARLTQSTLGFGGPSPFATAAGKVSVDRYFKSMQLGDKYKDIWIAPGESKVILNELSASVMKQGDVISLFADLYSDQTLQYDVIMIDKDQDPFKTLPYLTFLPEDVHNRGTYMEATRNIEYGELIGTSQARLMIGDNSNDPFLIGADGPTGAYKMNAGNFGVVYRIKLHRVAPNTLITFNPRGGRYSGVMMVNGNIVDLGSGGGLKAPNETSVLHRTGDYEQSVEFTFTAAPGSNLSVNLLFQQLPEKK